MLRSVNRKNKLYRMAFATVSVIILISLLASAIVISIANDMFSFMKKNVVFRIEITSPLSLKNISKSLQQGGIINNPTIFELYVKAKGKREMLENFSGELNFRSDMSYRAILNEFLK